jgi:hypothetical protein
MHAHRPNIGRLVEKQIVVVDLPRLMLQRTKELKEFGPVNRRDDDPVEPPRATRRSSPEC